MCDCMLLDPDDTRPPYAQVVDVLRRQIEDGSLSPGVKLPSHQQMADHYGVSVGTIKRSLGELQGAGLVISRQGQGAFVRTRRSILDSMPPTLSADILRGYWVTAYEFHWEGETYQHTDITYITSQSSRRLAATNYPPDPRNSHPDAAFKNDIEALVINRHIIGNWKNVSDARYFGALQLAVHTGESVLEGYYTSYLSDVEVDAMAWRWVRLDPLTVTGTTWTAVRLHDPASVFELVNDAAAPLPLSTVATEEA